MTRGPRCPTCKQPVDKAQVGKLFPFCGERCYMIDLGRWLGEEYRIPDLDTPVELAPDESGGSKQPS
jgi:uncharacterized protein